ncbi:MAG: hypothetical protein AAF202_13870, partial [Pseudomonadota bacterium]
MKKIAHITSMMSHLHLKLCLVVAAIAPASQAGQLTTNSFFEVTCSSQLERAYEYYQDLFEHSSDDSNDISRLGFNVFKNDLSESDLTTLISAWLDIQPQTGMPNPAWARSKMPFVYKLRMRYLSDPENNSFLAPFSNRDSFLHLVMQVWSSHHLTTQALGAHPDHELTQ